MTPERKVSRQIYDARRANGQAWRAWYKTTRWKRLREHQLRIEPLCRTCLAKGVTKAARVADHVQRHNGNAFLFWNGPLQSLCDHCHNSVKQGEEARGFTLETDADGWPTDARHPANAHHGRAVAQPHAVSQPPGGVESLGPLASRPAATLNAESREIGDRGPE